MFCLPCLELLGAHRVGDVLPTLFGTPWCRESGLGDVMPTLFGTPWCTESG